MLARVVRGVLLAVVTALVVSLVPAAGATARTVPAPLFGVHVGSLPSGAPARLTRVGAIRLWDSGVSWRKVETARGRYDWRALDRAVANAQALGAREILYTIGVTPRWAATNPNSRYSLYGPGTNSPPKKLAYYTEFITALATRYKGRITAYQVWNEANLRNFFDGTPSRLAAMTVKARAALRAADPKAKLVAASTTVRASGPVGAWGRAYGPAMRKVGWPVDAVSAHFYPPVDAGPGTRVAYIRTMKRYFAKHGAGRKPLWDTEINYGDTRSYKKVHRRITGGAAATYVARTYIDAMRYGVARVFWYGWDKHVLGVDMTSRTSSGAVTAGGRAYLSIQSWMVGTTWRGCKVRSKVTTCTMRTADGGTRTIRYTSGSRRFTLPKGTTSLRRLDGTTRRVTTGQRITLTSQPVLLIGG